MFFILFGVRCSMAANVQCNIENERIYCTYYLDRSDNQNGKNVEFHWVSPDSPDDDRVRHFQIPARHGSVYDYRFLPGRAKGVWHVKVIDLDTNETVETTFDINTTDDSMFEED
ncbi:hypothetical protein [Hydrogenimonas sp.]|uniref:hypothetical protein n=1 Tax=Hydrogenimonas sp. TaxID=2231112 RepID=UPI0026027622|nr:hypothetical protein [Hydrogenimonas sp.]